MILRRAARPMLAAIFISGGIEALRSPQAHARAAKPVLEAVGPAVDQAVEVAPLDERPDDLTLVKVDAGVKIVAGTMLAFGKFPRLASTALAASLIPTTLAGHRFWEEDDPEVRAQQQIHFLKNVGLLGGLLIASADTHGKPSLGWRARKAAAQLSGQTSTLGDSASELIVPKISRAVVRASRSARTSPSSIASCTTPATTLSNVRRCSSAHRSVSVLPCTLSSNCTYGSSAARISTLRLIR